MTEASDKNNLDFLDGIPLSSTTLLDWRASFCVGVPSIDAQHEKLLGIINGCYAALQSRAREANFILKLIKELHDYATEHFRDEERLFTEAGFPFREERIEMHRDFLKWIKDLYRSYSESIIDLREPLRFLVTWFVGHTQKQDRQWASFARRNH